MGDNPATISQLLQFPRVAKAMKSPALLVGLTAFLTALLVQSGDVGSIDTQFRLQTTHSFWTEDRSVPENALQLGVAGKKGRVYAPYGMGQSLLMLPADIAGSYLARLRLFADFSEHDPGIREIVVTYSSSILLSVFTALTCLRLLKSLEFTVAQAVAGALTLLFATTFLHYMQNLAENNLIFLLTLTGFTYQYEWLRTGRLRSLFFGSLALGANLLVRLTTAMDITGAALFIIAASWLEHVREQPLLARLGSYFRIAGPCYAAYFAIDRLYQYHRFGSFFNTYISLLTEQQKRKNPSLPSNFPWSTPLHVGVLGPLVTPEKSIFLFDPLIILTLLLALLLWKRFSPEVKAFLIAGTWLLVIYILFYARYYDWSGDFAWGDRYVTTPVQLLAMISTPLLLRHTSIIRKSVRRFGIAIACISVAVQLASVVFWHPLEIDQMESLGHPTFVVGLRFKNIAAVILGKVDQWGLSNDDTRNSGNYSNTPNLLPFLLKKDGSVSEIIADGLILAWVLGFLTLIALLWFIQRKVRAADLMWSDTALLNFA
jgi:hypothetical protein